MGVRSVVCSSCGGPLQASRFARSALCKFCGVTVFIDPNAVERARFRDAFASWQDPAAQGFGGEPSVRVGGRTWALRQYIGHGDGSDVHAGTLARRPTERVVVKLRRGGDAGRYERESASLAELQRSTAAGAAHFATRVPQVVVRGVVDGGTNHGRAALVLRWTSGFLDTLADVRLAYPQGIDPRASVWMWRRILETLAFAHRSGVAHGGLTPTRLLVHPREHGLMLVGWSGATTASASACAADLAASARAIAGVLEGAATPAALAEVLAQTAELPGIAGNPDADAWALRERVGKIATACFGPPRFSTFTMPGW